MNNPITTYWPNGNKRSEDYILNDKYHRNPLKGPARIWYDENGKIIIQTYWFNGKRHNPYGPAIGPAFIKYYKNDEKELEKYFVNDLLHRDPLEGPAIISYNYNEDKYSYHYFVNGKLHNPYRPAYNDYDDNVFEWWFNGDQYTKKVNEYLDKHELKWQNMSHIDFDIMWMNVL